MSHLAETPLRVVLGCAPEDVPAVRAIAQRLRVDGLQPWLMADELAGHPSQPHALRAALAAADALIVCVSRRSIGPDGRPVGDIARLLDLLPPGRPPAGLLIALKLGVCALPDGLGAAMVIELFGYSGYAQLQSALRGYATAQIPPPAADPAPPPAPTLPALALRGRFVLADLGRQGHIGRLGRGCARSVRLLGAGQALLVAGGGAALVDSGAPHSLWSIDCPARCAALSPSGRMLAIAGGAQIYVWDLADGQLRDQLSGHGGVVGSLAFSPDERSLAAASADRTVRIWRCGDDPLARTSPLLASLPAHPDQVAALAFSPDAGLLATGGADRTVRIWRTLDRTLVQTLSGHGGAVECLAFSPDGARLAVGSRGRSLRIWSAQTWRPLQTIEGHGGAVECLAFSPDGDLIASGAADQRTRVWQVSDGALRRTLAGHSAPVVGVSFSPDGAQLATLGEDNRLIIWRSADGGELAVLRRLSGRVTGLAFSADGSLLAVGGGDGVVKVRSLYDADTPRIRQIDHRGPLVSLAFTEAADQLITAAGDRTVRAYQLDGVDGEGAVLIQTHGAAQGVTLAPGGRLMACSDGEGTVQLWHLRAGGGQFWRVLRGLRGRPRLLCFSPRADALAVATEDGTVQVWSIDDLEGGRDAPQMTIAGGAGRVRSVAFSPSGVYLATGGEGGQAQLWQVSDGALRANLAESGPALVGLAFAPDGRSLAGGDSAGQVRIWPLARLSRGRSGSRRRELGEATVVAGHAGAVEYLAYSPAGDLLASGSSDGTVRLWRVP